MGCNILFMKNNVILFGSNGHLGRHIKEELEKFHNKFNIYLADRIDVEKILEDNISKKFLKKSIFINSVSIVGNENISKFSRNYIEKINSLFPLKLAKICSKTHSNLIHISSNSVFENSNQRYRYDYDEINAKSIYGKSKLLAENNIRDNLDNNSFLILRTPQQYSCDLTNKRNLFNGIYEQLKNYNKVMISKNELFSISSCQSIARFLTKSISNDISGIYHLSEPLEYDWKDIATLLIHRMGLNINKSLVVNFKNDIKQLNSTLCPSPLGVLESNLNDLFLSK